MARTAPLNPVRAGIRLALWPCVFVLAAASSPAQAPQPAVADVRDAPLIDGSAWRRHVKQALQADGNTVTIGTAELANPIVRQEGRPADEEIVSMPLFRVRGDRVEQELAALYREQDRVERQEEVMRRLGTTVYSARLFGGYRAGVMTVFYVPVFAAIQRSW